MRKRSFLSTMINYDSNGNHMWNSDTAAVLFTKGFSLSSRSRVSLFSIYLRKQVFELHCELLLNDDKEICRSDDNCNRGRKVKFPTGFSMINQNFFLSLDTICMSVRSRSFSIVYTKSFFRLTIEIIIGIIFVFLLKPVVYKSIIIFALSVICLVLITIIQFIRRVAQVFIAAFHIVA